MNKFFDYYKEVPLGRHYLSYGYMFSSFRFGFSISKYGFSIDLYPLFLGFEYWGKNYDEKILDLINEKMEKK